VNAHALLIPVCFVIAGCCVFIAAVHVAHLFRGRFVDDVDGDK
jgi:hypothetical protein